MSPRMAKIHIAVILAFFCDLAAACVVVPIPPCPPGASPAQAELDRAYYFSTINQEMVYAKLREDQARAAAASGQPNLLPANKTAKECLSTCPASSAILSSPKSRLSPAPAPAPEKPKCPHQKSKIKTRNRGPAPDDPFRSCDMDLLFSF